MHAKVEEPFLPSALAREAVHRILSTGNVEFCGGETAQMLHYLDLLTPSETAMIPAKTIPAETRPRLWQRLSGIFRA
ncbi:MAG: hypothetical protein E5Y88_26750 [Mesorhizobium sp.]|uniref:Uncharacterized protein n=1 Tax=Mesorhizobium mediterraneum TaxID=43617 RepID=A0AB36RJ17_9HYPH|nr:MULTISPECIES: hypothetical protein [Mesorhizobium]RUU19050.1 hypothetical protein EOD08_27360 [Mesorhizobium sp. M6A.T.Ca.TU.002.02.2.1]AZO67290.1 hypothetical protein EJ075_21800 [Mesorhizobium sp. M6A.T.Cr.TU.016.01.1.1]PAQ04150.1 hypothetical protein CIT25_01260 [Mesorhizobium mediterraneum]RUU25760.1 hypothetical protein EOC93_33590 [Mesorhizobium sp. M6A.T.Ce.TU.002.03.1.1]RUU27344.1 hypothetical protein EOC94_22820 [Mesorhizobium sp. M6A.T.Ce.TU.016.01.1.1]